MTEESNKKKRAVENEIMDTTSLQVKDPSLVFTIQLGYFSTD